MSLIRKVGAAWRKRSALGPIVNFSSATFSQYGEDLIVDRLLKPGPEGTYVDVGANHPIAGSNTYRLYTRGWSGLAIDANPNFAADYARHRPRDTFLAEGVSREAATLTYYSYTEDVFNTFDAANAAKLLAEGRELIGRTDVRCRPLSEIVDEHLPDRAIDLLCVDCEGLDLDVLASLDLTKRRPSAMIVEDGEGYLTFQQSRPPYPLERFLRDHGYMPMARSAWSALYVAESWSELFARSPAFDGADLTNGYMPGDWPLPTEPIAAT